jgi:hypothetical protein
VDIDGLQISARAVGLVDGANYRMAAKVGDENGNAIWVWAGISGCARADWSCP